MIGRQSQPCRDRLGALRQEFEQELDPLEPTVLDGHRPAVPVGEDLAGLTAVSLLCRPAARGGEIAEQIC